uniref:Uncharacterized protein n=1 Tax=Corticoviridae sp. TaxID=2832474 RepID=A0A8D9PDY5_9VIRU|nr:MAG TPA: hypothetical protein [Corticoviridae sp.]
MSLSSALPAWRHICCWPVKAGQTTPAKATTHHRFLTK